MQAGGAQRVHRRRPAPSAAPGRRGRAPRRRSGRAPAPGWSRPCGCGPGRGRPAAAWCRRGVQLRRRASPRTSASVAKAVTIRLTGDVTCFGSPSSSLPAGAHRQAVLADRDADAERRAQLHADRAARCRTARRPRRAGFAAGRHPVGRQLDARQLDRRGQQVGDGLGHRHAARAGASSAASGVRSPMPSPRRESPRSRPASRRSRPPAPATGRPSGRGASGRRRCGRRW